MADPANSAAPAGNPAGRPTEAPSAGRLSETPSAGRLSEANGDPHRASFRILAVCSGNVCRSPLVELLLAQRLRDRDDFAVTSAGTIARPDMRMTAQMVAVVHDHGIDESDAHAHGAQRLFEDTVAGADLILGLTREHRATAVQLAPGALRRTFTLTEFARLTRLLQSGTRGAHAHQPTAAELVAEAFERRGLDPAHDPARDDIDDPIGRSQATYVRVGGEIRAAVDVVASALLATRPGPATHRQHAAPGSSGPALDFSFRPA
ncbi:MAG: hypothetical protein FWD85_03840 [Microbacteriaceae bacterium]|nr:hypothetical protein [Microbacteriaceae bacterium]MCL2794422.1 hypothetical protein [Microbacteriaceae bacterium]